MYSKIIDILYAGEPETKKNEVRREAESYLASGDDDVFFSIADQALTVAIRGNLDEFMPNFLTLVSETTVQELVFNFHLGEKIISKAQIYLTNLDLAERVDLGKAVRILTSPDYRDSVYKIIAGKLSTVMGLLESRGVNIVEMYGSPGLASGQDYELFVSKILANHGCQTEITKGSGDQGADIIGIYRNQRFVVQCKFYSGAVGNKAVQEVHAAKAFYKADRAFVVSNANFTKSASELAERLGIPLLHHQDIDRFIQYLDS